MSQCQLVFKERRTLQNSPGTKILGDKRRKRVSSSSLLPVFTVGATLWAPRLQPAPVQSVYLFPGCLPHISHSLTESVIDPKPESFLDEPS